MSIPPDAGFVTRLLTRLLHRIMREVYTDMERMEQQLAHSRLRWTAVRPTRLTDDPATGLGRISLGAKAKVGPRTSRADLANYLLDAIDDPRTHRVPVAISS
ncbi:NAD(P)H-binding protein [Nocardia sp. NPDC059228]|uniref:NAD(P)H-binding protein n=1 Tax=Nocardia sp. NPDC059228 TaxID=3346777 RepID=UPI0036B4FF47